MSFVNSTYKGREVVRKLSSRCFAQTPTLQIRQREYSFNPTFYTQQQKQAEHYTIEDFLNDAIKELPTVWPPSPNSPYTLQEDIALLLEMAKRIPVNQHTFAEASKYKLRLRRDEESWRERYYNFAERLRECDINDICGWVQRFGVNGFARFEGDNFYITLANQCQPSQEKDELLKKSTVLKDKHLKGGEEKQAIFQKKKQLNQMMTIYSQLVKTPVKQLLKLLDQTSGDMEQLDLYLETQDYDLLWTEEEDKLLQLQTTDHSQIPWRTSQSIVKRKQYLGLL